MTETETAVTPIGTVVEQTEMPNREKTETMMTVSTATHRGTSDTHVTIVAKVMSSRAEKEIEMETVPETIPEMLERKNNERQRHDKQTRERSTDRNRGRDRDGYRRSEDEMQGQYDDAKKTRVNSNDYEYRRGKPQGKSIAAHRPFPLTYGV